MRSAWALAAASAIAFSAPQLAAQEQQPSTAQPQAHYKVSVHLVDVFVNVTDAQNAPVPGLTQSDFTLAEDGIPQKIAYFERETNLPLNIVLAIDTSGSVYKDFSIEKRAARDFVHALMRPVDRLDLIDFNSTVDEIVPFTSDVRRIDQGLNHLTAGPATALYNAIYLSSQRLAPRHGRKVLVVISDGGNTVPGTDYPQALEEAVRDEVMIYSIIDLPIMADAGRDTGGEHALISLSNGTGGKYYYAEYGGLSAAFERISQDLRTQYLIGYYPIPRRSESDFRHIQISLSPAVSGAAQDTLRYRPGYYAPPSPPLDQ